MTKIKIGIILAAAMLGLTVSSTNSNQLPTFEYPSPTGTGSPVKTVTAEYKGKLYGINIYDENARNEPDDIHIDMLKKP